MSWRIYNAWRVKAEVLPAFVAAAREHALAAAVKRVCEMVEPVTDETLREIYDSGGFAAEKNPQPFEEFVKERRGPMVFRTGMKRAFLASHTELRDWDCVDASLNIWFDPEDPKRFYVMPYGDAPRWADWMPYGLSASVKEFGWWNGSDRPDSITAREWSRREKVWRRLVTDHDRYRMSHVLIELKGPMSPGAYEIEKAILGERKGEHMPWYLGAKIDAERQLRKTEDARRMERTRNGTHPAGLLCEDLKPLLDAVKDDAMYRTVYEGLAAKYPRAEIFSR